MKEAKEGIRASTKIIQNIHNEKCKERQKTVKESIMDVQNLSNEVEE